MNVQSPLLPIVCAGRIENALRLIEVGESAPKVYLFTSPHVIRWLTGFNGSSGWLLIGPMGPVLITDGRYSEQAREQTTATGVDVRIVEIHQHKAVPGAIAVAVKGHQYLGFDGSSVSFTAQAEIAIELKKEVDCHLVARNDPTVTLRRCKTLPEVQRIELAASYADQALSENLKLSWIGMTERQLACELEISMRRAGADTEAFPTIVASGPNSSRPHHSAGQRAIVDGDVVIIDIGAKVDGYHSDMTRTYFVGQGHPFLRDAFAVVVESQELGVRAIRAGAEAMDIDRACRAHLSTANLDHLFVTGSGHGVGLQIHENPWIGATATEILAVGDMVTVEPGIYCEGVGGIRIEDTVSLESAGPRRLTLTSKDSTCPR